MSPLGSRPPAPATPPLVEAFWRRIPNVATPKRRGYPRVHANVPVRIVDVGEGHLDLRTNDLSVGGLQVGCDAATARRLSGSGTPDDARTFPIALMLKLDGEKRLVKAQAQLMHCSPSPAAADGSDVPGEIAIGFRIARFEADGLDIIRRFVEWHMRPAGG